MGSLNEETLLIEILTFTSLEIGCSKAWDNHWDPFQILPINVLEVRVSLDFSKALSASQPLTWVFFKKPHQQVLSLGCNVRGELRRAVHDLIEHVESIRVYERRYANYHLIEKNTKGIVIDHIAMTLLRDLLQGVNSEDEPTLLIHRMRMIVIRDHFR
jgi:hypothetical protein